VQDAKLFETILGVQAPWHISRVDLDTTGERVDLWAEHTVGVRWRCPDCDTELPGHDHADQRVWRHLDTCQFQTFLRARIPRVDCLSAVISNRVNLDWPSPRQCLSAFSDLMVNGERCRRSAAVMTAPTRGYSCRRAPLRNHG
jgi:transposase